MKAKTVISICTYIFILQYSQHQLAIASGTMSDKEIDDVKKVEAVSEEDKKRLSIAAGLLADYEIAAKKLIDSLDIKTSTAKSISAQANELLTLSENVISSAQFRLPQCNEYLEKTLVLKGMLRDITNESLEKDYHHDGALPKAPVECYHTKDLFVHPATVIVLTRDDPSLNETTKSSINAEITEVLGHLELVRQLVIY
jgi:hypothetical protein